MAAETSAWLSEPLGWLYHGSRAFGSFSPAATRFLYSSVLSNVLPVREMYVAFLAETPGLPLTVASLYCVPSAEVLADTRRDMVPPTIWFDPTMALRNR